MMVLLHCRHWRYSHVILLVQSCRLSMSMLHLCSVSEMSYFRNSECQEDPQEDNDLKEQLATYAKARYDALGNSGLYPKRLPTICSRYHSGGGTCQNFDRDARPIFLGLKFGQILFFWVGKFFSYFSGFHKISAIFLGLTNFQLFFWVFQFLYHTLESFK